MCLITSRSKNVKVISLKEFYQGKIPISFQVIFANIYIYIDRIK